MTLLCNCMLHARGCMRTAGLLLALLAFGFRGSRAWAPRGYRVTLTTARAVTAAKAAQCFDIKNGVRQCTTAASNPAPRGRAKASSELYTHPATLLSRSHLSFVPTPLPIPL
jgi:hypothetical protein